jgi:molybdopterin synthase catalytic subunit
MIVGFLTEHPIDLASLIAEVQSPERGGIACFIGAVRNHHDGRPVERLEYTAYGAMAETELARIAGEIRSRWPVSVALQHRIGRLAVGDTSVAIVAAAAHRDSAFAACRYAIEEVKRRVPIWKQEFFQDGTVEWVGSQTDRRTDGQTDSEPRVDESMSRRRRIEQR